MRYLNWKDQYTQMGKPYLDKSNTIELKGIKLQFKDRSKVNISCRTKRINKQYWGLQRIIFELVDKGIDRTLSYNVGQNRKNKNKNKKENKGSGLNGKK